MLPSDNEKETRHFYMKFMIVDGKRSLSKALGRGKIREEAGGGLS